MLTVGPLEARDAATPASAPWSQSHSEFRSKVNLGVSARTLKVRDTAPRLCSLAPPGTDVGPRRASHTPAHRFTAVDFLPANSLHPGPYYQFFQPQLALTFGQKISVRVASQASGARYQPRNTVGAASLETAHFFPDAQTDLSENMSFRTPHPFQNIHQFSNGTHRIRLVKVRPSVQQQTYCRL